MGNQVSNIIWILESRFPTARNFKFCVKHDWWSIRPPSKFQAKIVFISGDMRH